MTSEDIKHQLIIIIIIISRITYERIESARALYKRDQQVIPFSKLENNT